MNESESGRGDAPTGRRSSDEDAATIDSTTIDLTTIDSTIDALYRAISFRPGGRPRWDDLRALFLPGGRLIPPKREGDRHVAVLSVEEFITWADEVFADGREAGFDERDTHRITEQFGNVAHVTSTYEARHTPEDAEPYQRGVNSIQLARDGARWWVVTIFWDGEREDNPIPPRYLAAVSG